MVETLPDWRLIITAYLLGSIPFGLILGKLIWHTDLRTVGSKKHRRNDTCIERIYDGDSEYEEPRPPSPDDYRR